ncbi:MAG: CpsD/CapB family tyrosine-protein kinase [Candidatus Krumholzibacteria bacterium]
MSKIFDSLKWAEGERRQGATQVEEPAPPRPASASSDPTVIEAAGLPKEFIDELGALRNSLENLFTRTKRSILFASAASGEGTTTIATNFAWFLSLQGTGSVLLCEMNARRPTFTRLFAINRDAGITDYFSTRCDLMPLVQNPQGGRLGVVHAGKRGPAGIQLNVKQVMGSLITEALQYYDTVIIDAPPIISCPETAAMTPFVDGVVVVVQAEKTKREVVQRSMESIANFQGTVLGVVLNRKKYYIPEFLYRRV